MDNWEESFLKSCFDEVIIELQAIKKLLEEDKKIRESKLPRSI